MSSDIAIRVEKLGKLYRMGQFVGYGTLRESLVNAFSAPFRHFRSTAGPRSEPQNSDSEYIWALKDVSFEVKQGEVVGIIGRNGAGKTTLLKVLCRITEPTEGYAEIRGRVGSLLEVGTGFHPELTGYENIYLNGAVLGMKRKEIDRKLDEIVEFAEVAKFIDTPLKRFSTGMQVRLAFSVAAHLEPEILLVDEVLAVGDIGFQKKCLGKMHDVALGGRTVLFISHNMEAIQRLCQRTILLQAGSILFDGNTREAIDIYFDSFRKEHRNGPVYTSITTIRSIDVMFNGIPAAGTVVWETTRPLGILVTVHSTEPVSCPRVDITFFRKDGLKLFAIQSDQNMEYLDQSTRGKSWRIKFLITSLKLSPQTLYFDVGVRTHYTGYVALWQQVCDIVVLEDRTASRVTSDSILLPSVEVSAERLTVHGEEV